MSAADHEAEFADFFRKHDGQLCGSIVRTLRIPQHLAEEAAQFAFMVVLKRWQRLRNENAKAYLFRVATNEARKQKQCYLDEPIVTDQAIFEQIEEEHDWASGMIAQTIVNKLLPELPSDFGRPSCCATPRRPAGRLLPPSRNRRRHPRSP